MILNTRGAVLAKHRAMCNKVAVTASVLTLISFKILKKNCSYPYCSIEQHMLTEGNSIWSVSPARKPGPLSFSDITKCKVQFSTREATSATAQIYTIPLNVAVPLIIHIQEKPGTSCDTTTNSKWSLTWGNKEMARYNNLLKAWLSPDSSFNIAWVLYIQDLVLLPSLLDVL